ncbi:MAG: class I SAM-dependent RNA methyltransferase [Gemmatimonadales bacterium]|nr:class I SAM-dependent RNA methyltransferase [Gemmatimonadales bacterium]
MTAPVRILRLATGGDGVGRLEDGRTVFVPRTAPGDLIEISEIRSHRRYARARAARVLEPSADRVEPRCPHYVLDECGGCQLQHLDATAQREARRGFVGDALRRIARLDARDPDIVPAEEEFEYRTKITLAVDHDGRRIGLHPLDRPDRVFDLVRCHITTAELMSLWAELRSLRELLPAALRRIVLRLDRAGGRHLLLVGAPAGWMGADALRRALVERGSGATIWLQPEGASAEAMDRPDSPFPATVFEQVHPRMGDKVRAFALAALGGVGGRHVWDLYAGIGEATVALIAGGASVESVESDPRAVAEAEARGPAATRHVGRVERVLGRLSTPSLVITNPPRAGMDQRVATELERRSPARIVYISCDPATLARDLTRMPGFRLVSAVAFDLFPQTAHVETVAVLERAP